MTAMQIGQLKIDNPSSSSRYDPNLITPLEKYIVAQTPAQYDNAANLSLLKLYQFSPERANVDVIVKILAKSLVQLPNSDFSLCLYLIQEEKIVCL